MASMSSRVLRTLALLCLLASAGPLFAQQTGSIRGTVTTTDGATLPGVIVTARSDVLPQLRETVTGANGEYQLPALPPGKLHGRVHDVRHADRDAQGRRSSSRRRRSLDVTLGIRVSESITVTAESSVIDKDSATIASALSNDQILGLPLAQEYRDLAEADPGRAVHPGPDPRAERRRQRPGQRLPVRRRQRDAAAVRDALRRARLARHRAGDRRQGRRPGGRLRPRGRLLDRLGQQVGHQPSSTASSATSSRRRAWPSELDERHPVPLRAGPRLAQREPRRPDPEGPPLLLRVLLPADAIAGQRGQPLRRAARRTTARETRASAS